MIKHWFYRKVSPPFSPQGNVCTTSYSTQCFSVHLICQRFWICRLINVYIFFVINFVFEKAFVLYLLFVCFYSVKKFKFVELEILPSETIVGTNGSTINVTCSLKNNVPGPKKISWIRNGKLVSSNISNIITVTFLLTTKVHEQNLKCIADLDCINMPLEREIKFNVTCKYSRKFYNSYWY